MYCEDMRMKEEQAWVLNNYPDWLCNEVIEYITLVRSYMSVYVCARAYVCVLGFNGLLYLLDIYYI